MSQEIGILTATAASLAFIHTALGPDHYLPFIVISKARKWKMSKTMLITFLSGLGHVGSSVIIGSIGIIVGISLSKLEQFEGMRGGLVGWLFMAFGLIYMLYGIWRAVKMKPHKHFHRHEDGTYHEHKHEHAVDHDHLHEKEKPVKLTPWVLFLIFLFGPCEPLIPLLMFPAAKESTSGIIL